MKRFFLGLGAGLMLALGGLGAGLAVLLYTPVSAAGTTVKPILLIDHERIARLETRAGARPVHQAAYPSV